MTPIDEIKKHINEMHEHLSALQRLKSFFDYDRGALDTCDSILTKIAEVEAKIIGEANAQANVSGNEAICPTCGSICEKGSSDEGTNYFIPKKKDGEVALPSDDEMKLMAGNFAEGQTESISMTETGRRGAIAMGYYWGMEAMKGIISEGNDR